MKKDEYVKAQLALAELKGAVVAILERTGGSMTNAAIGRSLGIYAGHKGHEGHISRTLLAMLENEGVVEQSEKDQTWSIRHHAGTGLQVQ